MRTSAILIIEANLKTKYEKRQLSYRTTALVKTIINPVTLPATIAESQTIGIPKHN